MSKLELSEILNLDPEIATAIASIKRHKPTWEEAKRKITPLVGWERRAPGDPKLKTVKAYELVMTEVIRYVS